MNGLILSYALSAAGYAGALFTGKRRAFRFAFPALMLGLTLNVAMMLQRWVASGHVPFATLYDVLLALTAGIVLLSALVGYRRDTVAAGLFAGISALLLLGYASTLDAAVRPLVPALRSNILAFHVGSYLMGYAACTMAFATAVAYLWRCGKPGAPVLERLTHRCILFAFPFLTVGMSLGMVWANNAWGRYWGWDPKESWSLIAWLIYAYYVHMRLTENRGGRGMAWLSVAGFAAILFTLFGVNLFCDGLHSYR